MKSAFFALALCLEPAFAVESSAPVASKTETPKAAAMKDPFKNDGERSMYTIGFLMGRNVAAFNMTPAEVKIIVSGLGDAILGTPAKVDISLHQSRVNDLLSKRLQGAVTKEKESGRVFTEKFIKENKPQAIAGGGWYLETKAGAGPIPAKTDTIKAHYRGTATDGVEFDSSYARGAPTEFALSGVIACWTNGIAMMKVGGKAKLVCPSDVAYGDPGRPGIKPGATLIFEVELVAIVAAPTK